jgi:hypothetical protein
MLPEELHGRGFWFVQLAVFIPAFVKITLKLNFLRPWRYACRGIFL